MLVLAVFIFIGFLAGAVLTMGLRGRRVDDHPVCRKCRYDLVGAAEETAQCPECGRDLAARKAIRIGNRRKRPSAIVIGALGIAIALTGGGVIGYTNANNFNWNTILPTWVLKANTDSANRSTADGAMAELVARLGAGSLSQETIDDIIQKLLPIHADLTQIWRPGFGRFVEQAYIKGKLDQETFYQYLKTAVDQGISLQISDRVRAGAKLPVKLKIATPRLSPDFDPFWRGPNALVYSAQFGGIRLVNDDGLDHSINISMSEYLQGGGAGFSTLTTVADIPLPEGRHQFNATVEIRIEGPTTSQALVEWERSFPFTLEVLPADAEMIKLVDQPELADAMRDAVRIDTMNNFVVIGNLRTGSPAGHAGYISIENAPFNVAFEVFGRAGGIEKHLRTLVATTGRSAGGFVDTSLTDQFPGETSIDIIFRPSISVAETKINLTEIWNGVLIFEDLPLPSGNDTDEDKGDN